MKSQQHHTELGSSCMGTVVVEIPQHLSEQLLRGDVTLTLCLECSPRFGVVERLRLPVMLAMPKTPLRPVG